MGVVRACSAAKLLRPRNNGGLILILVARLVALAFLPLICIGVVHCHVALMKGKLHSQHKLGIDLQYIW